VQIGGGAWLGFEMSRGIYLIRSHLRVGYLCESGIRSYSASLETEEHQFEALVMQYSSYLQSGTGYAKGLNQGAYAAGSLISDLGVLLPLQL
jgi:hypothetical protein